MDACFGLSRKKSQGSGLSAPQLKDLFFGDHYSETSVSEHVCPWVMFTYE